MVTSRTGRSSFVLAIVLVAALAVGAAASILIGGSTASSGSSGPTAELTLPLWVSLSAMILIFGAVVAGLILSARSGSGSKGMNKGVIVTLVAILLGVLFVVAARAAGVGGQETGTGTAVPSNPGHAPPNATCTANCNISGPGGYLTLFPGVPWWVPYIVLVGVIGVLVFIAVPRAQRYIEIRGERLAFRRRPPTVVTQVRDALRHASEELDAGADPRLVILALYQQLLLHLQPMVGSMETSTAEEIRTNHLVRLGVRADAARTLTRAFEEARYSDHPMGVEDGLRAREAVEQALADLDRKTSDP